MSYIPKYIIKRMIPRNEAIKVVKKNDVEYVQLTIINVMSPIAIPDGDLSGEIGDLDSIASGIKISVNDIDVPVTLDTIKNDTLASAKGKDYTLDDLLSGKAGGETIAVGDKLMILVKKSAFPDAVKALMVQDTEITVTVAAEGMNITAGAVVQIE